MRPLQPHGEKAAKCSCVTANAACQAGLDIATLESNHKISLWDAALLVWWVYCRVDPERADRGCSPQGLNQEGIRTAVLCQAKQLCSFCFLCTSECQPAQRWRAWGRPGDIKGLWDIHGLVCCWGKADQAGWGRMGTAQVWTKRTFVRQGLLSFFCFFVSCNCIIFSTQTVGPALVKVSHQVGVHGSAYLDVRTPAVPSLAAIQRASQL